MAGTQGDIFASKPCTVRFGRVCQAGLSESFGKAEGPVLALNHRVGELIMLGGCEHHSAIDISSDGERRMHFMVKP